VASPESVTGIMATLVASPESVTGVTSTDQSDCFSELISLIAGYGRKPGHATAVITVLYV